MVDYIVENTEGLISLRQLLRKLEDTEHTFTLVLKTDAPSLAQKDMFTAFLNNLDDVTRINDEDWSVGLLEVTCTPGVLFALIHDETLLEQLRAVNYRPPKKLH